jgi:hypothetical protein
MLVNGVVVGVEMPFIRHKTAFQFFASNFLAPYFSPPVGSTPSTLSVPQ